jgi:hypothetical protein
MVKLADMPTDSQSLKKQLHEKIERLSDGRLSLVSRVLLQLEAEEAAQELDAAFDEDRKAGKLASELIQQVLTQVRTEHGYRL